MSNLTTLLAQAGTNPNVSSGDSWDLETFLSNSTGYMEVIGGAFLSLVGIAMVVWGGFVIAKKLFSERSQESWIKAIGLIIIGGAFLTGGAMLVLNFARGGADTIENFGNNGGGLIVEAMAWAPMLPMGF